MFIVESYSSGEIIQYRNFCVRNDSNTSHVTAYNYYKNEWVKVKDTILSKINLESDLLKDNGKIVDTLTGNNATDIILSELDSKAIKSRYYISLSLEAESCVQKILKMWEK